MNICNTLTAEAKIRLLSGTLKTANATPNSFDLISDSIIVSINNSIMHIQFMQDGVPVIDLEAPQLEDNTALNIVSFRTKIHVEIE